MSTPFTAEDRAFIRCILDHPEDRMTWLAYADWLDERDQPVRAAFLRVSVEMATLPADDPGRSAISSRLLTLRAEVDPNWAMVFDTPRIGNCGDRWRSACPLSWDRLTATDIPDIRLCLACRQPVFYCQTLDEAREFVSSGECVAVSTRVFPETETPFVEPEVVIDEMDSGEWEPVQPAPLLPEPEPPRRPWWKFW
ncbi:MAG TPA: TIGR02996 domain-containing protein [Gemmataceae bacterium]|nr:TIGR02996 domain-containing protein [Gemmataceae bacterium]